MCLGWDTSQIPQWSENSKYKYQCFETPQDLAARHLTDSLFKAQIPDRNSGNKHKNNPLVSLSELSLYHGWRMKVGKRLWLPWQLNWPSTCKKVGLLYKVRWTALHAGFYKLQLYKCIAINKVIEKHFIRLDDYKMLSNIHVWWMLKSVWDGIFIIFVYYTSCLFVVQIKCNFQYKWNAIIKAPMCVRSMPLTVGKCY